MTAACNDRAGSSSPRSLRSRLTLAFVGLAAAPLVLAGLILAWQTFRVQKAQTLVFQQEVARRVAAEVAFFLRGVEGELRTAAAELQREERESAEARGLLETVQRRQPAFHELSVIDDRGRESLRISRVDVFNGEDLRDRSGTSEFTVPRNSGRTYYGPVTLDALTGEPFLQVSLPLPDARTGGIQGVLAAQVRFKPVWDLIGNQLLEQGQDVYVLSSRGELVAHRNPSLVLRARRLALSEGGGFHVGLGGDLVALAREHVALGGSSLTVAAEQQLRNALALPLRVVSVVLGLLLLVFLGAGALGLLLVNRIVRPVEALSKVARAISEGDQETVAPVEGEDEIGRLGKAFNEMTGRLRGALKTVKAEVNERKAAEERLASEKERLAVTLRSIGDGVIATDVSGCVTLMNNVAEHLTGWSGSDAQGRDLKTVFPIINAKTRRPCENPVEKVIATGEIQGLANHTVLIARNGAEYVIADSASPIRDGTGAIIGVVLVFRDVTAQEKMEEEIARAQQLESLSVLAGGIAHDFNNLLTAILGNVSLARLETQPGERLDDCLARAEAASLRARDLTQQMLTFARGGSPLKKLSDVGQVVEEAAHFACTGSSAACQVELEQGLWAAEVDGGQIAQVVNNLLLNAVQAMPGGGTVRVRLENALLKRANASGLPAGSYVRVSVRDEGPGIPADLLNRIFEPYYTTKEKGHGLGLAVCHSIVTKHDGHLTVHSNVGEGSTFEFLLPASPGRKLRADSSAEGSLQAGQGRVLVMDDEESIRTLTASFLESLGYQAEVVPDGAAAVEAYTAARFSGKPFAAVISDLTIPGGMGGKEMVEHLLTLDPDARVIVSSGYANDPILANFREYGFRAVVAKPYRVRELSAALAEALGRKKPEEQR